MSHDSLQNPEPVVEERQYSWQEIVRRLRPSLRPHRRQILGAGGLIAVVGMMMSVGPLFTAYIIDVAIVEQKSIHLAALLAGAFVASQLIRVACWWFAQKSVITICQRLLFDLRSMGFRHLQHLCLRFHNRHAPGFLYEKIFGGAMVAIGQFSYVFFNQLVTVAVGLVFALFFCLRWSVMMTCIILVGTVGYVVIAKLFSRRIYTRSRMQMEMHNRVTAYIMDMLRGTRTIQAFAMEERVQADFDRRVWDTHTRYAAAQREILSLNLLTESLGYLLTASIFVGGAYAVLESGMPVGRLVGFIGYQALLLGFVQQLVAVYGQFSAAKGGFDQLLTVLDTQSTVPDAPKHPLPSPLHGRIELRNASFRYGEHPVLSDLSVTIEPGTSVALVGRSGSGKTTILNILMRFYDPDSGTVLLDGIDARDLPLRAYRSLFGVVLQDPYLFDDTIAYNLRCARPDATDAQVREVLEKAQALPFVEQFPDKLDHRCGEGGSQLSGGQKQRIAMARCMILGSKFVILDEPTSALDTESELLVQRAMDNLFSDRTVFIIAHRLSTIRRVDRILVIDEGRIVEDGNYDNLIEKRGLFWRLHSLSNAEPEALEPSEVNRSG